jgi:two-component system OmpR family sensor kinase
LNLTVEDDGPGIPASDLARVFEEGYSTDPSSSGRGLAIVRTLAQEAGGEARAEVRALGGARLRVMLPIRGGDEIRGDDEALGDDDAGRKVDPRVS